MDDKLGSLSLSFDEFKLYYESTEKVTDRRLDTNRWNYSICIGILVAIAVLVRWSLTSAAFLWIGFAGVGILSIMAILFCALWVGQIKDFKKLNNAKFAVLNDMAPHVEFNTDKPKLVVSYCPFEKEWMKLSALNALDEVGKADIVVLKSSNIEYFIPKAFGILFALIFIAFTIVIAVNWPPLHLVQSAAPPSSAVTQEKHQ